MNRLLGLLNSGIATPTCMLDTLNVIIKINSPILAHSVSPFLTLPDLALYRLHLP